MQLCTHCGYDNREGVVFCEQCGIALVPVPLSTRQLVGEGGLGGTDELGIEGVLILQVGDESPPIMVQVRDEVILGRVTDRAEGTTFINLSDYGADEYGVSRQHCRLLREHQAIYLMDLHSTNGTRLNGEPLPAGVEKRLRDGDEITLGRLRVYIFFKGQ